MPSIGKMAAQMTLDSGQFTSGLRKAEQDLTQFGGKTKKELAEGPGRGIDLSTKQIKGLGKAAQSTNIIVSELADSETGLGKALVGFGTAATFAATGNYILAAVFALKTLAGLFTHTKDEAEKAFDSIIDGSKSAAQAIADFGHKGVTEGLKELAKDIFPRRGSGNLVTFLTETNAQRGFRMITEALADQQRLLDMTQSAWGRWIMQVSRAFKAQKDLVELGEEQEKRSRTAGMSPFEARLSEITRHFANADEVNAAMRTRELYVRVREFSEGFERASQTVGMTADELHLFELAELGASQAVLDFVQNGLRALDLLGQFRNAMRQATNEIGFEGLSPLEKLARQLQAVGMAGEAAQTRTIDALQQIGRMSQEMRTPLERYADEMDRLTKIFQQFPNPELEARARGRAFDQLINSYGTTQAKPGALQAGSQAAYSAINEAMRGPNTVEGQMLRIQQRELQLADQRTNTLERIRLLQEQQPRFSKFR